jgi:hypothetical protein
MMSDTYQAVYDAVRSRISGCDVGQILRDAANSGLDASHAIAMVRNDFQSAAWEMQRPAVLFRPEVFPDGDKWCALYGKNLQAGVAGFGDTPAEAMIDFDANWNKQKLAVAKVQS